MKILNISLVACAFACMSMFSVSANAINYTSQDVVYYNADKSLHFGATLTLPKGIKKAPIVILVSGTGPQNRDGEMAGHKMFAEIADYLSNRGIAVLRTDDRGVGKTNGVYSTSNTADFADDVMDAIAYLKTRKDINKKEIGLIGHSEGGAVISIVASRSKDVAFMISLAGLATDGLSSVIRQNKDIVAAANIPDYDKKRYGEINQIMFDTAYKYADADSATLAKQLNDKYNAWKVKDDAYFKSLNVGEFDHFRFPIYMYTMQATGRWYRFFIRYNPAQYLSKVTIPVLALNGDKDVMVAYDQNLGNFKKYLCNDKDVTTKVMHGLNHLFLPCEKGTQDEYVKIKAPMSGDALKIVYDWIKSHVK
jgi:pimeloyl-ACP methyl ester carboxylesterase